MVSVLFYYSVANKETIKECTLIIFTTGIYSTYVSKSLFNIFLTNFKLLINTTYFTMGMAFTIIFFLQVSSLVPNFIFMSFKNRKKISKIIYILMLANKKISRKNLIWPRLSILEQETCWDYTISFKQKPVNFLGSYINGLSSNAKALFKCRILDTDFTFGIDQSFDTFSRKLKKISDV